MDFSLNEIQEEFKGMAKKFLKEKCTVPSLREAESSEKNYSPELYQEMANLGLLSLIIPEEYGGMGGTLLDLALVIEEAGYAGVQAPFFSTIAYGILPILKFGSEKQKQELLPKIAEGKLIVTAAFSESQAHYDWDYLSTVAAKNDSNYSLNGKKLFVPFANSAHYFLTLAKTTQNEVNVFLVKNDPSRINISHIPSIGPDRLFEVDFKNVSLTSEDMLGEGNTTARKVIEIATALQCVEMVGVLKRALDVTNDYVKERRQFGRAIGTYQSVQHRLSDMFAIVEGGHLAAYHAIWKLEEGLPAETEIAIAKAWLSKEGQQVLTGAHQLHGGMGIDIDYPLQFCYRRYKSQQLNLGPAPVHLRKISDSIDRKVTGKSLSQV